jgi:polyisoprenoid-binding protein YceI
MKRAILVVPVFLLTIGITGWLAKANENPTPNSGAVETVLEWVDVTKSTVKWDRHKEVKNSNSSFMLGNSKVQMKIDNATYNTSGDLKLKQGSWVFYDGFSAQKTGSFIIDLTSAVGLQVNDNEKLEFTSPNYLDVAKYPTATLDIQTAVNFGTEKHKEIVGKLTIKNTTKPVEIKLKNAEKGFDYKNLEFSFTIDGKEWGLINPNVDQEVVKDELTFHCAFILKL